MTGSTMGHFVSARASDQVISFQHSRHQGQDIEEGEESCSRDSDIISDKFLQFSVPKMTTMTVVVTREMIHHSWATATVWLLGRFFVRDIEYFVK